jgi:hypothetical protein
VLLRVVAKLLDPVGVVVELLEELRVGDRKVVALQVIVDVDLPVALDQVLTPLDQAHVIHVVAGRSHLGGDGAQHLQQRRRIGREADEDERAPSVDAHRHQAEVLLAEILRVLHLGAGTQGAVEAVGPAVIPALQRLAVPACEGHLPGPMAAHVVEPAELTIQAMRNHDRLVEDGGREEVPHSLQLVRARHQLPGRAEDPLLLPLEDRRVEVVAGRKGRGT